LHQERSVGFQQPANSGTVLPRKGDVVSLTIKRASQT